MAQIKVSGVKAVGIFVEEIFSISRSYTEYAGLHEADQSFVADFLMYKSCELPTSRHPRDKSYASSDCSRYLSG